MDLEKHLAIEKALENTNINSAMANGTIIPDGIKYNEFKELKESALRKKQFKHDWLLACFSIVTGAISGIISSAIFWLITSNLE